MQGFFMGLKINYSEGPTMSKQKLTRAEALQAQSQWLDFGQPDLRAVLPGQKETADLSRGDSWLWVCHCGQEQASLCMGIFILTFLNSQFFNSK